MLEGRGVVAPRPVRMRIGSAEQRHFLGVAEERASRRGYCQRSGSWRGGLRPGRVLSHLGFVPKDVLPILIGLVGEHVVYLWAWQAVGREHVAHSTGPLDNGDGGTDLTACGLTLQVKTRRMNYGATLVRRVTEFQRLEPIDFDVLIAVEWRLGLEVDILGWCERRALYASSFQRTRFGHFNLELPDKNLLPMNRLEDHLVARLAERC